MNELNLQLKKCPLFFNRTSKEICELLSLINYRITSFKRNEAIFSPYQKSMTLGIVLSGSVDILKNYPSGKTLLIARKKPFDLLAEDIVFSELEDYPETYLAATQSDILLIHKNELLKLIHLDHVISTNLIVATSNAVVSIKKCFGVLSLNSIQEKISGYLYHEYLRTNSLNITLPFTKKHWAEHLNISRTSLSRELRILESEKIITFTSRRISIIDFDKLKELLLLQ